VMITATTVSNAIGVALALDRAIASELDFPALRIGLHAGPVVEVDDDVFGATVNVASRIVAVARPGEIVCTETVARIATSEGLAAPRPLGTVRLKHVTVPVALFVLDVEGSTQLLRRIDPVCRMQILADDTLPAVTYDGASFYFCSLECARSFEQDPEAYLPYLPATRPSHGPE
jgi:adenylate cyclase